MKRLLIAASLFAVSSSAFAIAPFSLPWKNHAVRDTQYKTADHVDGVFVLEFGANFCSYCNENAPNVAQLTTDYIAEPRVQVLDVLTDQSDTEITRWITRHRPNHPVLKDVGRAVWNQVGEQYIPTVVITDCHGEVQYKHTGVWGTAEKREMKSVIDGLLAETCE